MIELIITIAVVAIAAIFLAYHILRGKGGCSACDRSCPRR